MTGWHIRPELAADVVAIHDLTKRAFAGKDYAAGDEQDVTDRLRRCQRLELSSVVEHEGQIVGHIAFSRMRGVNGALDWYALGPISVEPTLQKRGIGSAMIWHGVKELKARAAQGVVLVGDPAYYRRFGFVVAPLFAPPSESPEYFQLLKFGLADPPVGMRFDPAFYGEA